MCESIAHPPLWDRCPAPSFNFKHNLPKQGTGTADHLTLLRLFTFLVFLSFLSIRLLPRCLVTFSSTAPAHPHATRVAVYPALFSFTLCKAMRLIDCHLLLMRSGDAHGKVKNLGQYNKSEREWSFYEPLNNGLPSNIRAWLCTFSSTVHSGKTVSNHLKDFSPFPLVMIE